uniref:Helicase, putative n=1 Tax=Arundo donax TaxID=35708 RepID=A0A0A9DS79_ARUDO
MLIEIEIPIELVFQRSDFSNHFLQEFHHDT